MQQEQLRAVILTTLHSAEYNNVRAYLLKRWEIVGPQGSIYDRGYFFSSEITWDILLGQCGTGNIESAIEAERAINFFRPNVILSLGLAHGLKVVQIGDIIAATKVYGYEYGKETEGGFQTRPEVGQSTHGMIHRARAEARDVDWQRFLPAIGTKLIVPQVLPGPLAAGDKEITSSLRFWNFLENHYNDTLAVDTSSLGFLGAAHAASHIEALIIRGIASTLSVPYSPSNTQIAAQYVSAFAFAILSKLTRSQFPRYETSLANPLVQLEQLAYGNPANDRSATLYPAASLISSYPMSEASKKALELFNKGNQDFQQKKYKQAIKLYSEALRIDKSNSMIYNNKGLAYFHLGEYSKALESYESAIKTNPSYPEAYSNQAATYHKLGDAKKAQASYQQAINLYKHLIANRPDETQKSVLQKHLASALTGLGDALYKLENYREARSHYTHALRLEPAKASAYVGKGNCRLQEKRFEDALIDYRQAIKYDPNNPAAYKGQGDAYRESKQWKKALEAYEQALLLKSSDAVAIHHTKGMVHLYLEEYQQALEAFREFHQLNPDDILGYKCLVGTSGKLQYYEEVLNLCAEVRQRFPGEEWFSTYQQKALLELKKLHQYIEEQDTTILPVINTKSVKEETIKVKDIQGVRRKVFVSYNHNDAKWLERLRVHLAPIEREGLIELWDDTRIAIGQSWQTSIQDALETAKVAITLVSADFLASDFIVQYELPKLLSRAVSEGLIVMPIIVSPCLFTSSALDSFQAANDPNKPLSGMTKVEREKILVNLAKAIRKYLMEM